MPENAGNPNILLVDNDGIVIEALADLFKRILPAVNIADSATSGVEALKLLTSNADQYALVLLDMSLEGMQGPEVCRRMRLADCSTPVLGMTSFSLNQYRVPLATAGAQGIVDKSDETQLKRDVPLVLSGGSLSGFETPMTAYARLKCDTQTESTLTNMQETIMNLCANEYLTDGEISERLGISIATVRKHMQNIVKQLNCRTQRQAIITWLKHGNER